MESLIRIWIIFIIVYIGLLVQSYFSLKAYKNDLKSKLKDKTDEQILDYIYNEFKL